MADRELSVKENHKGAFFVDSECIACDTCAGIAPDTFCLVDSQEYAYVFMQPKDAVQRKKAHKALSLCPVDSIGYDE